MKRIVSLSVFGENPRYLEGAKRQFELAKYWYPGWEFRLYIDDASRIDLPGANVIEMKEGDGTYGRLFPLFEEAVVIVRDADSRITAREAMAVFEWMESGMKFHLIHDHVLHHRPVMAGAFGVVGPLPASLALSMGRIMSRPFKYGNEEDWLASELYPLIGGDVMAHNNRGWFGESRKHMANPYEFVGNGFDENDWPLYEHGTAAWRRDALPESSRFQVGCPQGVRGVCGPSDEPVVLS